MWGIACSVDDHMSFVAFQQSVFTESCDRLEPNNDTSSGICCRFSTVSACDRLASHSWMCVGVCVSAFG